MDDKIDSGKFLLCVLNKKIGSDVNNLRKKLVNGKFDFSNLSESELSILWCHLKEYIVDNQKNWRSKGRGDFDNVISEIIEIARRTINSVNCVPHVLVEVAVFLHTIVMPTADDNVKDEISMFLEEWWSLNLASKELIISNTLVYLIESVTECSRNLKRLNRIKSTVHLLKHKEDIKMLCQLVQTKEVVCSREGWALFTYLFTIDETWMTEIHENIKKSLETSDATLTQKYVEIYENVCTNGSKKIRQNVAKKCLNDIIFYTLHTNNESSRKFHHNLLTIVRYFGESESLMRSIMSSDHCTNTICANLKSPENSIRYGAVEIFFIVFPILKKNSLKRVVHLREQFNTVIDLLRDSSSFVRVTAIKGAFRLLSNHWSIIPVDIIERWMGIFHSLTKECNDWEVRLAIFEGFKLIVLTENSTKIKGFIGNYGDSIYDENLTVRLSFLTLLLSIRSKFQVRVYDIVPEEVFLEYLETEMNPKVINTIVQILLPKVHSSKEAAEDILRMGRINITAVRKIFYYSKNFIRSDDALKLVTAIVAHLRKEFGRNENGAKKRKRRDEELDFVEVDLNDEEILLDVLVLIVLNENGCKKQRKIGDFVGNVFPELIDKFKDTILHGSVLHLYPALENTGENQLNFADSIIDILNNSNISNDDIITSLYVLIRGGRTDKVFDLLLKLFDTAVIHESEESMIRDQVILGHRILKITLQEFPAVVENCHSNLMVIVERMDFIFPLIEKYLSDESNWNSVDEVLRELLDNYLCLVVLMDKGDIFDASNCFLRVIQWTQRQVLHHISQLEGLMKQSIGHKILKTLFGACSRMIRESRTTSQLCLETVILHGESLALSCGITFVDDALVTMQSLIEVHRSFKGKRDKSEVLGVVFPTLLIAVMGTVAKYDSHTVIVYTDNFQRLSEFLTRLLTTVEETWRSLLLLKTYLKVLLNSAISSTKQYITSALGEFRDSVDLTTIVLPYLPSKIIEVIVDKEKYQNICVGIVDEDFREYSEIELLSALLIIHRMAEKGQKIPLKNSNQLLESTRGKKNNDAGYPRVRTIEQAIAKLVHLLT